mgnify:CR=1 FL=1
MMSFNTFAIEGVVTVLEAPLFQTPSITSKVIQHLRKGDVVYLHPSTGAPEEYEDLKLTDEEELHYFNASEESYREEFNDEFIEKNLYKHQEGSEFLKTIDKLGRDAYVLREHIYIYYQDEREFSQITPKPDPTDYRLYEPIPENYPFIKEQEGFRGLITLGIGTQATESYPYTEPITNTGTIARKEVNIIWSRRTRFDQDNRYYWGALFSINAFEGKYNLETRLAREQWLKIGIGPVLTYDFWKKDRISFVGLTSFVGNLVNTNSISQEEPAGASEKRVYKRFSFIPKAATYIRLDNAIDTLDFVAGLSLQTELTYNMRTSKTAENRSWWRNSASDSYEIPSTFEMALFIGFQSSI